MAGGATQQPGLAASTAQVTQVLRETITALGAGQPIPKSIDIEAIPSEAREWLDDLLGKVDTYRDGALVLFAYPVATGETMNLTVPLAGRRTVGQKNAELLARLNIACRKDPFQTIAKGSKDTLIGRERVAWNKLLTWASQAASIEEVRASFYYLASGIAKTARQLPAMPELDVQRLTYPSFVSLLDDLFDTPSGGVYQQYVFAALLHARYQGDERLRVETKPIHASDASSRVPGDVQVVDRQEPVEAYEVSANDWRTKLAQADEARRSRDLRRAHVVADAANLRGSDLRAEMTRQGIDPNADLSVLDFRHEAHSLLAQLSKIRRRDALERLYVYLAQYQSDDGLVQRYVELLGSHRLVVT
jgi:hypothetical protein